MSLEAMTDTQIVALIKTFEPHDEGGQPMISMHFDLWKRVLALGAIPRLNVTGLPSAPVDTEALAADDGDQAVWDAIYAFNLIHPWPHHENPAIHVKAMKAALAAAALRSKSIVEPQPSVEQQFEAWWKATGDNMFHDRTLVERKRYARDVFMAGASSKSAILTDEEIVAGANEGSFPGEAVNEGFIAGAKWARARDGGGGNG